MRPNLTGLRILVVDDDECLREILVEMLTRYGAFICVSSSGKNALECLVSDRFDAIISDMRMPDGDGLFLANEVAKFKGHKPIFFILSGYNDLTPEQCRDGEIKLILEKPIKMSALAEIIQEAIKARL